MCNDYCNILLFQGCEAVGLEALSDDGNLKIKLVKVTSIDAEWKKQETYQSSYYVRDNVGQNWEKCNSTEKYNSLAEFVNGLAFSSDFMTAYRILNEQLKYIEQ